MSTTVTGKQIRQALINLIGDSVEIGTQGATAGSTTTIVDLNNLQGRALPSSLYDNAVVRVTTGTRKGETSFVDYLDADTGTLHIHPAIGGALADGDEYEVWLRGINPDFVDRLRDECLATVCSTWRPIPISVITDGDLETAGVTSWTAQAGASVTKGLSTFPEAKSRWLLSVVHTTAATDFLDSTMVECQPGEVFYLEVPVKAYVTSTSAPATASVIPFDITGNANITVGGVRTTHTGRGWGRITIRFVIPSGCYQFKLRLKSDTASSTTVWGAFACHRRDATEYTCPDRIRNKKRVGKTFLTSQVNAGTGQVNNSRFKLREYKNVERMQIGTNVVLFFQPGLSDNAVYFYERGYFARLQTAYQTDTNRSDGDAATSDCPLEYIAAALAEKLTKRMLDKFGGDWQDDWVRASTALNSMERDFGAEPVQVHENEIPVFIPQLKV